MKRTINGEVYNTEKGSIKLTEKICKNEDTPKWQCETLYMRDDGKYFLYGEGGFKSPYADDLGENGKQDGDKIMPLEEEQAKNWVKENKSEDFEKIFNK